MAQITSLTHLQAAKTEQEVPVLKGSGVGGVNIWCPRLHPCFKEEGEDHQLLADEIGAQELARETRTIQSFESSHEDGGGGGMLGMETVDCLSTKVRGVVYRRKEMLILILLSEDVISKTVQVEGEDGEMITSRTIDQDAVESLCSTLQPVLEVETENIESAIKCRITPSEHKSSGGGQPPPSSQSLDNVKMVYLNHGNEAFKVVNLLKQPRDKSLPFGTPGSFRAALSKFPSPPSSLAGSLANQVLLSMGDMHRQFQVRYIS